MAEKRSAPLPAAAPMTALTEQLRRRARRITGPRHAILAVLREQAHPMTVREVHAALGDDRCDLATIYRAVRMLTEMDLVKRFEFGDGVARFELVGACGRGHHHHHLVCTDCGRIVEIEECFSEKLESQIARRHGFDEVTHRLEFFGRCPGCR